MMGRPKYFHIASDGRMAKIESGFNVVAVESGMELKAFEGDI